MKRRTFLTLAGAAAFPRVAFAQQPAKVARVAFDVASLTELPSDLNENSTNPSYAAFFQELAQQGFIEGRTVSFDRYNEQPNNVPVDAAKVVASAPDVIYCSGAYATALAAMSLTKSIPIVVLGGDPIGLGIVTNLAHPGANVTAVATVVSVDFEGKITSILAEAVPTARRIGYLIGGSNGLPDTPSEEYVQAALDTAAKLRTSMTVLVAENPVDETAMRDGVNRAAAQVDVLQIGRAAVFNGNSALLAKLCLDAKMPAISPYVQFAQLGGLLSYGADSIGYNRQAADYVAMVLKGAKPGDLPVLEPTVFDLLVNLKTAQAIGVAIPPSLLVQATEVIQ